MEHQIIQKVRGSGIDFDFDINLHNNIRVNILLENIDNNGEEILLISNNASSMSIHGNITNVAFVHHTVGMLQWNFNMDDFSLNNEIIKFDIVNEFGNTVTADITATITY